MNKRLLLLIFIPLAVLIAWLGRYQLSYGSDGIQYVNIACHYAAGNFDAAINAYWGPMVSWLMVPFIKLGFDPFVAFKIQRLLTAVLCFWLILCFMDRLGLSKWVYRAGVIGAAFFPLHYLLHETPDLLFITLSLGYILLLLREDYLMSLRYAIAAGILGAFLYCTKSFGFPFFLSNFLLLHLLLWWRDREAGKFFKLLENFSYGAAVFLILSCCWIFTISDQYGFVTLGTSGAYNKIMLGPENSSTDLIANSFVLPTFNRGLEAPPHSGALSSWEEPYLVISKQFDDWSISEHPQHYGLNVLRNFKALLYNDIMRNYFALVLVIGLGLLFNWRNMRKAKGWSNRFWLIGLLLLTSLNMIGGYLLILVQDRYLWLVEVLLYFGVLIVIDAVFRSGFERLAKIFGGVTLLLIAFYQVFLGMGDGLSKQSNYKAEMAWAAEINAANHFIEGILPDKPFRYAMAADNRPASYRAVALIGHYTESRFYGLLERDLPMAQWQDALLTDSIDFLFVRQTENVLNVPTSAFELLDQLDKNDSGVKYGLYRVKP